MIKKWGFFIFAIAMQGIAWAASVNLAWDYTQGTDPAVGFYIYRQQSCTGAFTKVNATPTPLSPMTFTDSTVLNNVTYCWEVTAADAAGMESTPSNVLQFSIPAAKPAAPSNLRGTVIP